MTTPAELLAYELRNDGSRPLFTFYDDASGERVELSVATSANWVAKTAGFLADEHAVDVDDVVGVRLPLHWQAAIVLLAGWAVGAQISFASDGPDPLVTFTTVGGGQPGAEVVELSLAPMGIDFSRLVAAQPDGFLPISPGGADLVDASPTELPYGVRVLSVLPYDQPDAVAYGLIGPLAVSGSLVLVANPDAESLARHAEVERVTHTLGVTIGTLPRLK